MGPFLKKEPIESDTSDINFKVKFSEGIPLIPLVPNIRVILKFVTPPAKNRK